MFSQSTFWGFWYWAVSNDISRKGAEAYLKVQLDRTNEWAVASLIEV